MRTEPGRGEVMRKFATTLACVLLGAAGCSLPGARRASGPRPPDWDIADEIRPAVAPAPHPTPRVSLPEPGPGIPLSPSEGPRYPETWTSVGRWSQAQGYGSVQPVVLPSEPLCSEPTNSFNWNHLDLKGLSVIAPLPTFLLKTSGGELVLQSGTRQAYWRGVAFYLGFAPKQVQGELLVRDLDLDKSLSPLLHRAGEPGRARARTIVIDPGHGGQDTGRTNVVDHQLEKTLTLDWAQRLARRLERCGCRVVLTRTNDVELPPAQRAEVAQGCRADLLVSLQFGYSEQSRTIAGVEARCQAPAGWPGTGPTEHDKDCCRLLAEEECSAESLRWAYRCQQALVANLGAVDRGVRRAPFAGVWTETARPAVMIVGGYLSNPQEAERIGSAEYRERLAEALAKGLVGT